MFAQLGDDAGEDQVLSVLLEGRDVHDVDSPILELSKRQIDEMARVRYESGASLRDVDQTIPNFSDRRDVMSAPGVSVRPLETAQKIAKPILEIGKRLHGVIA